MCGRRGRAAAPSARAAVTRPRRVLPPEAHTTADRGSGDNALMTDLAWGTLSAPVGRLSVGCGQAGVSQIRWGYPPGGPRPLDAAAGPAAQQCSAALSQLAEYFAGQRHQFEVPVDWSGMSRLQQQ